MARIINKDGSWEHGCGHLPAEGFPSVSASSSSSFMYLCTERKLQLLYPYISICAVQIFFSWGESENVKRLASQVQPVRYWKGTIKYGHLYGRAIYGTASLGASWILKHGKNIMDQFPGASWSAGSLLLAIHRPMLRLGQPLGSPNVTVSHHCSISIRNW